MNPTIKYKNFISKIHQDSEVTFENLDGSILIQHGKIKPEIKNNLYNYEIIYTCNLAIFIKLKNLACNNVKFLEFNCDTKYVKLKPWNLRKNALYYHGRIIPGKINLDHIQILLNNGINVVLQGPICQYYWLPETIHSSEMNNFKRKLNNLKKIGLKLLDEANEEEIVKNLNNYKYYYTSSNGETYNLALQEALQCGTIPLIIDNSAYLWANNLYVSNKNIYNIIKNYNYFNSINSENYSTYISNEINNRNSNQNIIKKLTHSFYNINKNNFDNIPFELSKLFELLFSKNIKIINYKMIHFNDEVFYLDLNKINKSIKKFISLNNKYNWTIKKFNNNYRLGFNTINKISYNIIVNKLNNIKYDLNSLEHLLREE